MVGSRVFQAVSSFDVGDVGDFPVPKGIKEGKLNAMLNERPEVLKELLPSIAEKSLFKEKKAFQRYVSLLSDSPTRIHSGLAGVHRLVGNNWAEIFNENPVKSRKAVNHIETAKLLYMFSAAASYRSAAEIRKNGDKMAATLITYVSSANRFIRSLVSVTLKCNHKAYKSRLIAENAHGRALPALLEKDLKGTFFEGWDVRGANGVWFLRKKSTLDTYIVRLVDIKRLEFLVRGIAHSRFYAKTYDIKEPSACDSMLAAFDKMLALYREFFRKSNLVSCNWFCRGMNIVYHAQLGRIASDITTDAFEYMCDKWKEDNLDNVLGMKLSKFLDVLVGLKVKDSMESASLLKVLPQPDFDHLGLSEVQRKRWATQRTVGTLSAKDPAFPVKYKDIKDYHKHVLIRAYHQKHGFCPGHIENYANQTDKERAWVSKYPHVNPDLIAPESVFRIKITGSFFYQRFHDNIWDAVKDTSIIPGDLKDDETVAELRKRPIKDRSYLMNVLFSEEAINLDVERLNMRGQNYDVLVGDKPECAKPNGRWYYEFHTKARLLQSEYERSIGTYGAHAVGYVAGKDLKNKVKALNAIHNQQTDITGNRRLYLSFDLKDWSPGMPLQVHKDLDEFWADAFNIEQLKESSLAFTEGKVHYMNYGIHHVIKKSGTDLEGIAGKKLTFYHIAVIGRIVRTLRQEGLIDGIANFVALIDDGLLKVYVPAKNYKENVKKILKRLDLGFQEAGLQLSWDKTLVSEFFSVFLNNARYKITNVTAGIRAFLKITNVVEGPAPGLPDGLEKLAATSRAAITSGAYPSQVYMLYAYYLVDLFRKWGPDELNAKTNLVLWAFAPQVLGGYGCPTMHQMVGSFESDVLTAGIGVLRALANRYKRLVPFVNAIINKKIVPLPLSVHIAAPDAVRIEDVRLQHNRIGKVVQRELAGITALPSLRVLVKTYTLRVSMVEAAIQRQADPPSAPTIRRLYMGTLEHALQLIANKFLKANSAISLCKKHNVLRAFMANKMEALKHIGKRNLGFS